MRVRALPVALVQADFGRLMMCFAVWHGMAAIALCVLRRQWVWRGARCVRLVRFIFCSYFIRAASSARHTDRTDGAIIVSGGYSEIQSIDYK